MQIQQKIFEIRGQRVMLDFDLAELYEVETRALKQAVRRNEDRFPPDFMFRLKEKELNILVSQNVIPSKSKLGGALPFAFTEQGVAMLSSVLKSKTALHVNIAIMRAFVTLRQFISDTKELSVQLEQLRQELSGRIEEHDVQLSAIYDAIENLLDKQTVQQSWEERNRIGFKHE